ncbi:MAG TPA: hypothetical protein PKY82_18465 [Pyrinomonadaceae bacterium]|nr:hypothetical protein [Pyrinomonadaceae bacterium]
MPTTVAVANTNEVCTEFRIKVMIYSPESGYKFDVTVQKKCFPTKWIVIFNLYKKIGTEFVQIVGVEFDSEKKEEQKAVEAISQNGVNMLQSRAFKKKVYPAVKVLEDGDPPTEAEKKKIHTEMSKAILLTV